MQMRRITSFIFSFIFIFVNLQYISCKSQERGDTSAIHELTIFVIPSHSKLNWESPSSLYRSSFVSYTKSLFHKNAYSIGHLFIELSTPILDSAILTSIRSTSNSEKRGLILRDKIGLGILGASLHGRMERREELIEILNHFAKKKKIAFIKYRISYESALRVIEFISKFTSYDDNQFAPCNYYGGAFWPLYEKEGAGCTSFGLSAMQTAGLNTDIPEWQISVNIPINLVGGKFNNGQKVKKKSILRAYTWHNGKGEANVDFIPLNIYDPSLIYQWIIARLNKSEQSVFYKVEGTNIKAKHIIPGLYIDSRNIPVRSDDPIFTQRKEHSLFIDVFLEGLTIDN